jgi:hypothetical protein
MLVKLGVKVDAGDFQELVVASRVDNLDAVIMRSKGLLPANGADLLRKEFSPYFQ